jgi:hypothetical protein
MDDPAEPPRPHTAELRLNLEQRTLLVVAGMPGAGKSTLLRNTHADPSIVVLDTDQMRERIATRFAPGTPYYRYRPLVHILHEARVLTALVRTPGPVVVHDPATGPLARTRLVIFGILTRRTRRLLWLECTDQEAIHGQRQRGRVVLPWVFHRHTRAAQRIRTRLHTGRLLYGWHSATITDRTQAGSGLYLHIQNQPKRTAPRKKPEQHPDSARR